MYLALSTSILLLYHKCVDIPQYYSYFIAK